MFKVVNSDDYISLNKVMFVSNTLHNTGKKIVYEEYVHPSMLRNGRWCMESILVSLTKNNYYIDFPKVKTSGYF